MTICNELSTVHDKTFQIGIQLGFQPYKIREFMKKEEDPLAVIIEKWLGGDIKDDGPPPSWQSVVNVLRKDYVGEIGLANRIEKKYCLRKGELNSFMQFKVHTQQGFTPQV